MASQARQFGLVSHSATSANIQARQFALVAHVRVTPLSSPIQARQFAVVSHARIIHRERVLEVGPPVIMSFPYGTYRGE
jgi:hypothetical protein